MLLTLLPLGLLVADSDYRSAYCPEPMPSPGPKFNCRTSVSGYHDMADAKWFFVPLTVAAVMFIINGLVRDEGHAHNAWLGFALLGVIVFDHESETFAHYVFAVIFFASAIIFISGHLAGALRYIRNLELNVARLIFVGVAAAQLLLFAGLWRFTNLFIAEWVQLLIIAIHFVWHSLARENDPAGMPDPEPLRVLEELLGPLYAVVAAVLTPATVLWRWLRGV